MLPPITTPACHAPALRGRGVYEELLALAGHSEFSIVFDSGEVIARCIIKTELWDEDTKELVAQWLDRRNPVDRRDHTHRLKLVSG